MARELVPQYAFEVRLVEHVGLGKSVGREVPVAREAGEDPVLGVDQLHAQRGRLRAANSFSTPAAWRMRMTSSSRWTARGSG